MNRDQIAIADLRKDAFQQLSLIVSIGIWLLTPIIVVPILQDGDARQIMRTVLEEHYTILEAHDGAQALSMIQSEQPNLVILDIMMPNVDGFEVLERLHSDQSQQHPPVIVVTAEDLTQQESEWLLQRSRAYFQKSQLSLEAFLDYVQQLLRKAPAHGYRS